MAVAREARMTKVSSTCNVVGMQCQLMHRNSIIPVIAFTTYKVPERLHAQSGSAKRGTAGILAERNCICFSAESALWPVMHTMEYVKTKATFLMQPYTCILLYIILICNYSLVKQRPEQFISRSFPRCICL